MLRQSLLSRYFGAHLQGRRDSKDHSNINLNTVSVEHYRRPSNTVQVTHGPGAAYLSRAARTLTEVQCYLDNEGATKLVAELIMKNPSRHIFVECVELGIALLEGGNPAIQVNVFGGS